MLSTGTRSRRGGRGTNDWPRATTRYEAVERIGEGTLFVVYRVRDRATGRDMALKALRSVFARHPGFGDALIEAAHGAQGWAHPNLAEVHEVGEEDGTIFIVCECLPGPSLDARLKRGPLSTATASTYFHEILRGLAYLHQQGGTHGDLRPRQIMHDADGHLRLTDAGLSEAFTTTNIVPTDVLHDTAFYLAPERADGAPATAASDLYAAGAVLYQMLTGRVPFDGPSPLVIARRHRNDTPLPPSSFNPDCPAFLEDIALCLLEKDPQRRYASARDVLRDFEAGRSPQSLRNEPPQSFTEPTPAEEAPAPSGAAAAEGAAAPEPEVRPAPQPIARAPRPAPAPAPDAAGDYDDEFNQRLERKRLRQRDARGALLAFVWTLVAVGVLCAIVTGAWYFWIQGTPDEVVVPEYVGLDETDAASRMQGLGIKLEVRREAYDPKKQAGIILSGDVPAGRHVRVGREIHVTVSQGPAPISMPNFVELTLQAARQIIVQHGMRLGQVAEQYHERIPAGYICDQYPPVNQSFRRSDPINLIVSKGPLPRRDAVDPYAAPPTDDTAATDNTDTTDMGDGTTAPAAEPTAPPNVLLVSRAVRVRVAIPTDSGSQEVRIVVTDAKGERNVYRAVREPGDMVDRTVRVSRQQGTTATIRVYVGDVMVREQHV